MEEGVYFRSRDVGRLVGERRRPRQVPDAPHVADYTFQPTNRGTGGVVDRPDTRRLDAVGASECVHADRDRADAPR